jgi:hypothetical protein
LLAIMPSWSALSVAPRALHALCGAALGLLLAGCGGGEVAGTVSGLGDGRSVTLLNNGGDATAVRSNGRFAFNELLDPNTAYVVTVGTQPVGQLCSVSNGSGTINDNGDSVDNVAVSCVFSATLRGTVSGLAPGVALVLGHGNERVNVVADGAFAFQTELDDGTRYTVELISQPAVGSCALQNASGIFYADRFTDIVVNCN